MIDWAIIQAYGHRFRIVRRSDSSDPVLRAGEDRIVVEPLDEGCPPTTLRLLNMVANQDHGFGMRYIAHYPYEVAKALEEKLYVKLLETNERLPLDPNRDPDEPLRIC